jgi:hypothetical protein
MSVKMTLKTLAVKWHAKKDYLLAFQQQALAGLPSKLLLEKKTPPSFSLCVIAAIVIFLREFFQHD